MKSWKDRGDEGGLRSACPWRDVAALHVLDVLNEGEREGFGAHLLEGCGPCGAELREARDAAAAVDLARASAVESDPGPEVRARVLKRIRGAVEADGAAAVDASGPEGERSAALTPSAYQGIDFLLDSEEGWESSGVEGTSVRLLARDAARGYSTVLIRMEPGARFPAHRHNGREECYVLKGDLSFGTHRLEAGDFQVAESGTVHPEHRSDAGCLLLVVASDANEVLPG